jgi:hypothetical protein
MSLEDRLEVMIQHKITEHGSYRFGQRRAGRSYG